VKGHPAKYYGMPLSICGYYEALEMECSICKKKLSRETASGKKVEGHYVFFNGFYCIDCWKKNKPNAPSLGRPKDS